MSAISENYEAVIGLEVHIQLLTNTKAFSGDRNEYGGVPNSHVSPITLGHPGTLPHLNEKVIEMALSLGLACDCDITRDIHFARKNYFYPDLPKGYQITQDETPICRNGSIRIEGEDGSPKDVGLIRIHMEEDSGKSIHDQDPFNTLIDLNRAGTPLLEMVSRPVIASSNEAYNYLAQVRKLVRYLEICDGNMEEGSLRCDANVSVRRKGDQEFGTRTEVKNMNSLRNVKRAIEHEIERQAGILEEGGEVEQVTLNFDPVEGKTILLRGKETADDYRYFPEPDLQPVKIEENWIERVRNELPPLPDTLYQRYVQELGLPGDDAAVLTDDKAIALYFQDVTQHISHYKAAANWVRGPVRSHLNKFALRMEEFPLPAERLAELIELVQSGKVSNSKAEQDLFPALLQEPDRSPEEIAKEKDLIQTSDEETLEQFVREAIEKYPEKVEEYRNGKTGLVGLFMGEVMKRSKGKADPKKADRLVREKLEEY
jgi:aspartyl-tRNA(Asn)/glutamyl-tRNA(Gln) amidotransferase subunit B